MFSFNKNLNWRKSTAFFIAMALPLVALALFASTAQAAPNQQTDDNLIPIEDLSSLLTVTTGATQAGDSDLLAPCVTPGPDGLGYTCAEIPIDFMSISGTGTLLSLGDDDVSAGLPFGFDFDFYGTTYTQTYASSNGFLHMVASTDDGCCTGESFPTPGGDGDAIIAGWWEDFDPPEGGTVHYETVGTAPNRIFILQLTDIEFWQSGGGGIPVTYQYKLYEGTNNIEVHYLDTQSDGTGIESAGIENQDGTSGLQYYFGTGGLTTPTAVRYSAPVPLPPGSVVLDVNKGSVVDGDTITYTISVANNGILTATTSVVDTFPAGVTNVDCTSSFSYPWSTFTADLGGGISDGVTPLMLSLDTTGMIPAGHILRTYDFAVFGEALGTSWLSHIDMEPILPVGTFGVFDLGDAAGFPDTPGPYAISFDPPFLLNLTPADGVYEFVFTEDIDDAGDDHRVDASWITVTHSVSDTITPLGMGNLNDNISLPPSSSVVYECVGSLTGLSIEKTPDTQGILAGDDADFTINIANSTGTTLTVTTSDPLVPACDNMLDVGMSGSFSCTDMGVASSYTNTITATANTTVTNVVMVSAAEITNTLTATATDVVALVASDSAVVNIVPPFVDLSVDKSAVSDASGNVTYTIAVMNSGNVTATTTITDNFPTELTNISCVQTTPGMFVSSNMGVVLVDVANGPTVVDFDTTGLLPPSAMLMDLGMHVEGTTFSNAWASELEITVTTPDGPLPFGTIDFGSENPTDFPTSSGAYAGDVGPYLASGSAEGNYSFSVDASFNTTGVDHQLDVFTFVINYVIPTPGSPIMGDLMETIEIGAGQGVNYVCNGTLSGLEITKSPDTQDVVLGYGDADFTIDIVNTTGTTLTVTTTDPLVPACDNSGQITDTLSYGCTDASVTGSYTNTISVSAVEGVTLTNVVTVTAVEITNTLTATSTDMVNYGASDTAVVNVVDPFVSLTADKSATSDGAGNVFYNISVTNNGNITATTTITDVFPAGISNVNCMPLASFTSPNMGPGISNGTDPLVLSYDPTGMLPAGAMLVSYALHIDGVTIGGSWLSEINMVATTPDGTVVDVNFGTLPGVPATGGGTYNFDFGPLSATGSANGVYTLTFTEGFDDGGDDQMVDNAVFTIVYTDPGMVLPPGDLMDTVSIPAGAEVQYQCSGEIGSVEVSKTPDSQDVALGDPADFTITVTSTVGAGVDVIVSDPLVPACDMNLSGPGVTTYGCSDPSVASSYVNEVFATAQITASNQVTVTAVEITETIVATTTDVFNLSDSDTAAVNGTATISLTKTVGTVDGVCAMTDEITVDSGDTVYYCYEVTNTTGVTLTVHDLVDDQLGVLMNGVPYDLGPGASLPVIISATVNITTTNVATWTASLNNVSASATDSATVNTVVPIIDVDPAMLMSTQYSNTVMTQTLTIGNVGGADLVWTITERAGFADVPFAYTPAKSNGVELIPAPKGVAPMTANGMVPSDWNSAGAVGNGPTLASNPATTMPTIDGDIAAGEWDDAFMLDISISAQPVMMYVKHTDTMLYFAFDDMNDLTLDTFDQVGLYLDDEGGTSPILWDNVWTNPACQNDPTLGEGNYWLGNFAPDNDAQWREWVPGPTACAPLVAGGTNVTVAYSIVNGNMQYEIAVPLDGSAALAANPGDEFGYRVYTADSGATFTGRFPDPSTFNDPSTYANLQLPRGCQADAIPWASVNPTMGTTMPGMATDVEVTFDSTGLASGMYTGTLCIDSNDPMTPYVEVPLKLTVCGAPDSPTDVTIMDIGGMMVQLDWTDTGDTGYEVWYMIDTPYFEAGDAGATKVDIAGGTTTWVHNLSTGDPADNYYYIVTNSCGLADPAGADYDRTGEFDFAIVPGTP